MKNTLKFAAFLLAIAQGLVATPALAESPAIQLEVAYTGDIWTSVSGGIGSGSAYLDNLDVTLDIDAESLWGLSNTRFFLYGLYNNGSDFSSTIV
ncbi:MAG: hypothetical protein U5K38_16970 [Woeseiaceae bacterium]|nr:hypothetical protein [Woeseiaceae bacterium]